MKNSKPILVLVLGLLALSGCARAEPGSINVSATATVEAKPEVVVFDFLVEERGKLLKPLKNSVDRKATALVKLCKRLGIEPKDLTSAEITIEPQYHYNTNRFTGYEVSRTVTARLYNLDKYSKVIDGAVNSGITTIRNISLQLKDDTNLEDRALRKAVDSARAKAQLLAQQGQVKLGKVTSIIESGSQNFLSDYVLKRSSRVRDVANEAAPAPYAFEPGQLSVTKTIQMSFEIN